MEQREIFLQNGFSYSVKLKVVKGREYTQLTVLYYDIEIYHSTINWRVNTEKLFLNICEDFLQNSY
jgi:hypothetical protein